MYCDNIDACHFPVKRLIIHEMHGITPFLVLVGKLTVIVGRNGSGKTSLLAAILREMRLISGELVWHKWVRRQQQQSNSFTFLPRGGWRLHGNATAAVHLCPQLMIALISDIQQFRTFSKRRGWWKPPYVITLFSANHFVLVAMRRFYFRAVWNKISIWCRTVTWRKSALMVWTYRADNVNESQLRVHSIHLPTSSLW